LLTFGVSILLERDPRFSDVRRRAQPGDFGKQSRQVLKRCRYGRRDDLERPMSEGKFLTPDEVSERYRGEISTGTLRNWRALRIGPSYVKVGKGVLYPLSELDTWDRKNVVVCRASR
jgi:hypothetical protein